MESMQGVGLLAGVPSPGFITVLIDDYKSTFHSFLDANTGAVKEGARDDGRPPFLFSEATGYAVKDLLHLYFLTGEMSYLEMAKKAGYWLTETARDDKGWMRTRYYFEHDGDPQLGLDSFTGGNLFSFDNAICLWGLTALWALIQDVQLRQYVEILANNLIGLVKDNGSVPAVFQNNGQEVHFDQPRWSQRSGAFHTKVAEALTELHRYTENERYADAARRMCEYAMSLQQDNGRFITDAHGNTQLHPHCYAAEGLLAVGTILREERFIESAYRAVLWALGQSLGGRIPQEISPTTSSSHIHCRTDSLAQVLSLGARFIQLGRLPSDGWGSLGEIAAQVLAMKHPVGKFFRYGIYENGQESNTRSYWTNSFAFQSLLEYTTAWVNKNTSVLVLAGGIGSRCWPISCLQQPKALCRSFLGDRSLLEETASRFLDTGMVRPAHMFVVASTNGLQEARQQMGRLQIPQENVLEELHPEGTLGALRFAMSQLEGKAQDICIISMADNLIEPRVAFRITLLKAVLSAWWDEKGRLVSLGVPNQHWDQRFGHAVYDRTQESIPGVYIVERFVEKPQSPLEVRPHESYAWDSGCVVSVRRYIDEILHELPKAFGDLSRLILENPTYRKAVSLYPPLVRFVDLGAPGKDLRQFFSGTAFARDNGNVVLGPLNVEVTFLRANRNVVISDRLPVEVVGLNDHLIIDNSFTESAVILPLEYVATLPVMYRMFENVEQFRPYIAGGIEAKNAPPHHAAHQCHGQCDIKSQHGLALAIYCSGVGIERSPIRLRAVGTARPRLSDFDVDILKYKKHDPSLIRHLIDVTTVAEIFADPLGFSHAAREVLHLLCLTHDFGGFLTDENITAEKELDTQLKAITGLDWITLDTRVLQKLVRTASEIRLTPKQETLLEMLNDSINSAVEILEIEAIRSHPYRDELLFLLCNQERPAAFRRPLKSRFSLPAEHVAEIFSCFVAAEIWVNAHCLWKRKLRPRADEDIGRATSLICLTLQEAGIDPSTLVHYLHDLLLDEHSSLLTYTRNELRVVPRGEGEWQQVPLFGSDLVYIDFIRCRSVNIDVVNAIARTLLNGQRIEKELLLRLPSCLKAIANCGLFELDLVRDLAREIINECSEKRDDVWQEAREARHSILDVLR